MKLRFSKLVTVDYADLRLDEVIGKTFDRNQLVEVADLEINTNNFFNLHFENGDVAIGVPKNSFEVLA